MLGSPSKALGCTKVLTKGINTYTQPMQDAEDKPGRLKLAPLVMTLNLANHDNH